MSSLNVKTPGPLTYEGAQAKRIPPYQQLRRSVLSCLLWEKEFYEEGVSIAQRILDTARLCTHAEVAGLALEARTSFKLRHVPLLLLCDLARRGGSGTADVIASVIQRADEMAELMAIYQSLGNKKVGKQLQKGLAKAFNKFNAYQLAKYNRDGAWKLRDILFISHAKPQSDEQAATWLKLINGTLESPDTWEVELSAGKDKGATFTRLILEKKLGGLALLRNLRNMEQSGVDRRLVQEAINSMDTSRILPFRFIAAARHAPFFEPVLDRQLIKACKGNNVFKGTTIVLVDVSGSMLAPLSGKSDLSRMDAACTLASIIDGDVRTFSFSSRTVEVPHRLGVAGVDTIKNSQRHVSTNLREALEQISRIPHDRLIVVTDEQASSSIPNPVAKKAYMINVASYRNGVGYGKGWVHIDGFSESVLSYIKEVENA